MPTIIDTAATLFVFCPEGACPGYRTEKRDGISREVARTAFEEAGPGTINGGVIATSHFQHFVPSGETDPDGNPIPDELPCPHCQRPRQVSPTDRPVYQRMSGQRQDRLLQMRREEGLL